MNYETELLLSGDKGTSGGNRAPRYSLDIGLDYHDQLRPVSLLI